MQSFILFLFSLFPQIQMVALCNSRAMGEADKNSDIDLFIIAKKWHLWTARFIVTAITSLLFVRRKNTHGLQKWTSEYTRRTKNKFCLSFFITEDAMDLTSIRLQPDDPYLDRWIRTLQPLVNKNGCYERFLIANGVENNKAQSTKHKGGIINKSIFIIYYLLFILSFFEWYIKRIWLRKTLRTYEKLGKPWWVIISDTMLKFHDNDHRKIYRKTHR